MNGLRLISMIFIALLLTTSCSQNKHPELRVVTGSVTYQGEPVVGAVVAFHHDKAVRLASGQTDANGKFSLTSFDPNDGALPGEHRVVVTKTADQEDDAPSLSMDEALNARPEQPKRPRSVLPKAYASKTTTPLILNVADDGPNDLKIVLED